MKSGRALLVLAMVLTLPATALSALSIDELDANASLVFMGSNPPSGLGDPNLVIAPLIGVSLPLRLSGPWFLEPGLEFLGTYYEWDSGSGSAVLTQSESGLGFFTVGALISLQGGMRFPISPVLSFGGAVGLDFFLRFPFELQNTVPSEALGWFLGGGRFFYPETRVFMRWHLTDPVDLLLNIRAFYPLFHLWDGSGQPFGDSLMVSGGIGFAIRLRPAAPASAPK